MFTPNAGEVFYNGQLVDKKEAKSLTSKVGIVFQDPDDQIISLTVREDVAFGPLQLGISQEEVFKRVDKYLKLLGIEHLASRNPSELSYGQKKYVTIAGILAMETDVFILDEPMAFLDPKGKESMIVIMDMLNQAGKTVIVTTHDMQFVAEWAEEVIVIHDGQCLGKYTPAQLFANKDLIEKARLNYPPTVQLFKSFWKETLGEMPIKITDCIAWLEKNKY
ncbi:MAG: cobalt/nickel transport system ATP-binding protein [Bacillales bacterium]|nr:cobalt/nickel transport system ATP-binding protein [Bacillales bacterium]